MKVNLMLACALASLIAASVCFDPKTISFEIEAPSPAVFVRVKAPNLDWIETMLSGVKRFESYKPRPYLCPAGVKTIGYGSTGEHANVPFMSKLTAEKILNNELTIARKIVLKNVKVKLSENQICALTSFVFNCGEGSLKTLVNGHGRLNGGNFKSVEKLLPKYCKGGGKVLNGLVERRAWEVKMWKGQIS